MESRFFASMGKRLPPHSIARSINVAIAHSAARAVMTITTKKALHLRKNDHEISDATMKRSVFEHFVSIQKTYPRRKRGYYFFIVVLSASFAWSRTRRIRKDRLAPKPKAEPNRLTNRAHFRPIRYHPDLETAFEDETRVVRCINVST